MVDHLNYAPFKPRKISYVLAVCVCLLVSTLGIYSAVTMEHAGHIITGMNNHVVWGLPHVFAVSLIVAASGALNGSSLSTVFGLSSYKPIARLSVVFAMSLLIGGLLILVLDLGRPDRLIIAVTQFNFRSIFAWNIFLYTGFLIIGVFYLWTMIDKQFNRHIKSVGWLALVWRIVLTSGTGSIFGFLVGRNALDTAVLAPLFIALSLLMGTAALILKSTLLNQWRPGAVSNDLLESLARLLFWFLIATVYFSAVHHLTNLYVREHADVEQYVLRGGLSGMFWLGHILFGVVLPIAILKVRSTALGKLRRYVIASNLSLLGGMALLYTIIIGSQSTPQNLFPGKTVLSSSFGDAGFPAYLPSMWEWGLGFGGVSVAVLLCLIAMRLFPLVSLPATVSAFESE